MKKLKLLLQRVLQMVPVLVGISIISFLLLHAAPADPVRVILGPRASEESMQRVREEYGLDQPVMTQYVLYMGKLIQGDWGRSIPYRRPVLNLIQARVQPTLYLLAGGMIFSVIPALIFGVVSAFAQDSWLDQMIRFLITVGLGLPSYWLALVLVLLFAVRLGWLPSTGFGDTLADQVRHLILPSITIGIAMTPILVRNLRSTLLDKKESDFVIAARAKGLPESYIFWQHTFPNSILPSLHLLGIVIVYILGISIVIEPIFDIEGLGHLFITSIIARDYLVVQGLTLIFTVITILATLSVDVLTLIIDPRIE